VPFTVTFAPQSSGTSSASISFSSNASNSTLADSVRGTGAVSYSVGLSWSPSTSTVAGYNVYRGGISGGPYTRINSSLATLASYSDATVQSGTYYYVTTAIDSTGLESTYSNEASAVVP
jgi:fibronectin type 3 domain-containing protein